MTVNYRVTEEHKKEIYEIQIRNVYEILLQVGKLFLFLII